MNKDKFLYFALIVLLGISLTYNIFLTQKIKSIEDSRYWMSGSEYEKLKEEINRLDYNAPKIEKLK